MPVIYLSPSTQEGNYYVNGGTEEQWMNLLADAMIPYLDSCGIQYVRNTPEMTAASSIRGSNAGTYDLHLALHSNASAPQNYGANRGILVFYSPSSAEGARAARIMADNLKVIYPLPNLVEARATTSIGEVRLTRAPSVFLELGYHDNPEDATWVKNNLDAIARNLVLSLTEYFFIPFLYPVPERQGIVDVSFGALNIRARPDRTSAILARAYDGARLTIINEWQGWYLVHFGYIIGYASSDFITVV